MQEVGLLPWTKYVGPSRHEHLRHSWSQPDHIVYDATCQEDLEQFRRVVVEVLVSLHEQGPLFHGQGRQQQPAF